MALIIQLLTVFEVWLYGLGVVVGLGFVAGALLGYDRMQRTPFGLEKENARQVFNAALAGLFVVLALTGSLYLFLHYLWPGLEEMRSNDLPPTAVPYLTPTAITIPGSVAVDSSGCANPNLSIAQPGPNERIAGSYEVSGTATIDNFAFYKIEISNATTNGAWVTLIVGDTPKMSATLGRFDASAYTPGDYAFRLAVQDSAGNSPPPCVIAVTLAGAAPTAMPEP